MRQRPRHPVQLRRDDRHERADGELPHPRGGDEVGPLRRRDRLVAGPEQGRYGDRGQAGEQRGPPVDAQPGGEQHRAEQQQRPDEVELLLHRQRPVVLDGGRRDVLGEVVDGPVGEPPVHEVEGRGDDVAAGGLPPDPRHPQPGHDRGRDEDDGAGREQALGPPGVEPEQVHRALAVDLLDQLAGDHEAGDHEEHVDPDVAAGEEHQSGVVRQHQEGGHRPQPLDVATDPGVALRLLGPAPGLGRGRSVGQQRHLRPPRARSGRRRTAAGTSGP